MRVIRRIIVFNNFWEHIVNMLYILIRGYPPDMRRRTIIYL